MRKRTERLSTLSATEAEIKSLIARTESSLNELYSILGDVNQGDLTISSTASATPNRPYVDWSDKKLYVYSLADEQYYSTQLS